MLRKSLVFMQFGLAAGVFVLGCTGSVGGSGDGDGNNSGQAGNGNTGNNGAGNGPAGGAGPVDVPCEPTTNLADAPVRRLSQAEYRATVRDLFPGIVIPMITLTADAEGSGFQNRATLLNPSDLLVNDWKNAAFDVAALVMNATNRVKVLPCTTADAACGAQFVSAFGPRAFRRPITAAETKTYTDFFNTQRTAISFNAAIQLTIEAMLLAPQFLYRVEFGDAGTAGNGRVKLNAYETASRLSYFIWGSMPDSLLFDAAKGNKLGTVDEVDAQVRRMMKDPKARDAMIDFHRQWLSLDKVFREAKDPTRYPAYSDAVRAAIREESDRFVGQVMFDGDATLKSLLTSSHTMVNADLAKLYGVTAPASGWAPADLKQDQRAGFLTRANFLAGHGHKLSGSPPLRSVFIMNHLLCQVLPPPPGSADTSEPKVLDETKPMTNRQLFAARTASDASCAACHDSIDPIGFTLENYDAVGAYRTTDSGFPVDASADIVGTEDIDGRLTGGVELSRKIADSAAAGRCMTQFWYENAYGRAVSDPDLCQVLGLNKALAAANGDVRELQVMLAKTDNFLYRPVVTP